MQEVHQGNRLRQLFRARQDMDVHQLSLGMRVNGTAREQGFVNHKPDARNADNLYSHKAQHIVVRRVTVAE